MLRGLDTVIFYPGLTHVRHRNLAMFFAKHYTGGFSEAIRNLITDLNLSSSLFEIDFPTFFDFNFSENLKTKIV